MLNQAFKVLTEFKFEVGSAIASSNALQGAVGGISTAADNAMLSFQRLGVGFAAQMGLGSGGMLGILYKGIQASDKFYQAQLKISNVMQSNGMFTGADGFDRSMRSAEGTLLRINKAAREFSLPAGDMVNLTTQIGAVLTVKKLDDAGLTKSTELSRQFLKSAPILGVDPGLSTQQLVGAISGRAELSSTLVQRLLDETSAMKPYQARGTGLAKFNALEPAKRLDVLTKSLAQFSSNAKVTDSIAKSMSGQIRRLNDNLMSMFSIFRPLGDALMGPITKLLGDVNKYIETHGAEIVKNMSGFIGRVFANPEQLYVTLRVFQRLKGDVTAAGKSLAGLEALGFVLFGLGFLGIRFAGILGMVGTAFRGLVRFLLPILGTILPVVFKVLAFAAAKILPPLLAIVFLFNIISAAIAKAEVANAKWLADNMAKITKLWDQLTVVLGRVLAPFAMAVSFWSDVIAWFFKLELSGNILIWLFEGLVWALDGLGKVVVGILGLMSGAIGVVVHAVGNLVTGNFKDLMSASVYKDAFNSGFDDLVGKYYKDEKYGGASERQASKQVVNVDKINIINQFKEQMEPDRIAFSLKEQIFKAASNPQQSARRSVRGLALGI